ncbi:MAG TPA: response regulator [Candidatus Saccharimonadales bacterium]|nr:response regulator [Candidatus Saccharimonadales bacterium]
MSKILIIDDDYTIAEAYKIAFESNGHEVSVAPEGKTGLGVANSHHFDVILLDMLMPYMGGVDFLVDYQGPVKHPDTKIIVLTNSLVPAKSEEKVKRLGASDYLQKSSLTPQKVVGIVEALLK